MGDNSVREVVILGGGSAGWLAAGSLAAEYRNQQQTGLRVTLIESPDVAPIGVGEGTWPSMRTTLQHIGISEHQFITECGASFKQGSKFVGWRSGQADDQYYHPFVLPEGYAQADMYSAWQRNTNSRAFADYVCAQPFVCEQLCAPKQLATPQWAGVLHYGFHLDAAKFSTLLHKHCVEKLGVQYVRDHVTDVIPLENGDIGSLRTKVNGDIAGDLFIDCTGTRSILLAGHFQIPFKKQDHILFNDSAIATHIPYVKKQDPIASATVSTAQGYGWIWDIGLPDRKGVGHTYSSKYVDDNTVEETLRSYASGSIGDKAQDLTLRKISFTPGYYTKFWHKNCVAIGLSAGFIEPLEASALALVELSCNMLKDEFPANRQHMDIIAQRFNDRFTYRWERVIEFLKLHYVLSERTDSDYWIDHKNTRSIPQRLTELLELWKYQSPSRLDFNQNEEVFPSASYQYVLYGMGFVTNKQLPQYSLDQPELVEHFAKQSQQKQTQFVAGLPTNRDLIEHYRKMNG